MGDIADLWYSVENAVVKLKYVGVTGEVMM